jgi:hypothetical protein
VDLGGELGILRTAINAITDAYNGEMVVPRTADSRPKRSLFFGEGNGYSGVPSRFFA